MSRWRPPPPRSTAIITRPGFDALKAELDHLWRELRPEVVKALAAAAAEGDRSENAEYTYRKKQLGEISTHLRLRFKLQLMTIVAAAGDDSLGIYARGLAGLSARRGGAMIAGKEPEIAPRQCPISRT